MSIVTPEPTIGRDRYGRPLVIPPGGGKPVAYTRCTTYVGCLEDTFNLSRWQMRQVALGLAQSPDLMLGVTATDPTDKKALDAFCGQALERSKAGAAATTGTALHALTETIDRGEDLPVLPAESKADLEAYREATKDLSPVLIEQFCVQDALQIGGTPDRVVEYQGKRYIADLKTGSIEWGALKIAMQLAVYARSQAYDIATGERSSLDTDLDRALIIHLPAGQAKCTLHWVDIKAGWLATLVARDVREQRTKKFTDLTRPFGDTAGFKAPSEPKPSRRVGATRPKRTIVEQVEQASTRAELEAIWRAHEDRWTDDLTDLAAKRAAALTGDHKPPTAA